MFCSNALTTHGKRTTNGQVAILFTLTQKAIKALGPTSVLIAPYGREAQFDSVVNDPLTIGAGEYLPLEFPLAYWLEEQGTMCLTFVILTCLARSGG